MGNDSSVISIPPEDQERILHVRFVKHSTLDIPTIWLSGVVVFEFSVGFQRYTWKLFKRYKEVYELYSLLSDNFPSIKGTSFPPRQFQLWKSLDESALLVRGESIAEYLETIAMFPEIMKSEIFWDFLEVSRKCFAPELGRKGKAGYLKKVNRISYTE
jgi:hypothetical protein